MKRNASLILVALVCGSLLFASDNAEGQICSAPTVTYYAPVPAAPVTTYYAPAPAAPVTTYYAPSAPVTAYYAPSAPVTAYYAPSAPVTAYYAPAPTTVFSPVVPVAPVVRTPYWVYDPTRILPRRRWRLVY